MRQFSRIFVIALTGGILFSAVSCKKTAKHEAPVATEDSVATDSVQADTTVTGVALESGMSTIYLCTLGGDTIECDMEDELGSGNMYGYDQEGDTMSITYRKGTDGGKVVTNAWNMTLLHKYDKGFVVRNGVLYLDNSPATIESLDDDEMKFVINGEEKTAKPKSK